MTISGSSDGKKAPHFCADFEREIGGVKYKQCVSVNANDSVVSIQNNKSVCYENVGTLTCTQALITTPSTPPACAQSIPITPCSATTGLH